MPEPFAPITRIIVKFRDDVKLPFRKGIETSRKKREWGEVAKLPAGCSLQPLLSSKTKKKIETLVAKARDIDPTYEPPGFSTYFVAICKTVEQAQLVRKELLTWKSIEYVAPDLILSEPAAVNFADDPRSANQGYLDPASAGGIDAKFAWTVDGGDGEGLNFIDLERGWDRTHQDFPTGAPGEPPPIQKLDGVDVVTAVPHGTKVLGIICSVDNTIGGVGITPRLASVKVVSAEKPPLSFFDALYNAILVSISNLGFGDVLLIEEQLAQAGINKPCEIDDLTFALIRLATALGIVVIEPAGNGGADLNTHVNSAGQHTLDPSKPLEFKDSGAIVVGASRAPSSASPLSRLPSSNFGERIDCFAWGELVATADPNNFPPYTNTFSDTSAAAAIIAGAALSIQGMARKRPGFPYRFSPRQLREILRNPSYGTPSFSAADRIRVMPDLRKIAQLALGVVPDLYLRDFVGDTGAPNNGPLSVSPDIIVLPNAVANPQAAFGEGSGSENSNTLGAEVEAGQDNFIYVRVRNCGPTTAMNVQVNVYWSEVMTLLTPALWKPVSPDPTDPNLNVPVIISNVPAGNVLTVAPALVWRSANIPKTGHYCFVGLIGNALDPAPLPADFKDWAKYQDFVRNNNNVTWRNFNVVDNV